MTVSTDIAGVAYADLIKDQLTQERARKASIEARGIGIITTSGALVTLLFAVPALATTSAATYTLPSGARVLLVISVFLFLIAALAGLMANMPTPYDEVHEDGLDDMVKPTWWSDADKASADRAVAAARVGIIKSGREASSQKAWFVIVGIGVEVAAVTVLAAAAVVILVS
jgi:hypothetical protein